MTPDYLAYHESIAAEIAATKDRIRNLIGSDHWQTDGEHKEAVLRNSLRTRLAEKYHVGRGFVCYKDESSGQLDLLILNKLSPTLFKDGELFLTTPDSVAAIVEVKTSLRTATELADATVKLSQRVKDVRSAGNSECWAGLFSYEACAGGDKGMLDAVRKGYDDGGGILNCVASGPELFVKNWEMRQDGQYEYPAWHSYNFSRHTKRGLAFAYFLSNLVMDLSQDNGIDRGYAWFPIAQPGGKEQYRTSYVLRHGDKTVKAFSC